jgi:hypothetical protein
MSKGRLLLEHAYPANTRPVPRAWTDVSLVLESTKSETFATGNWVHVVGYTLSAPRRSRRNAERLPRPEQPHTSLQAILIWDAGPVKLGDYETVLGEEQLAEKHKRNQV